MRKKQMMALLMSGMVLTGVFAGVNTAQADAKTEITLWHYFSTEGSQQRLLSFLELYILSELLN